MPPGMDAGKGFHHVHVRQRCRCEHRSSLVGAVYPNLFAFKCTCCSWTADTVVIILALLFTDPITSVTGEGICSSCSLSSIQDPLRVGA